MEYEIQAQETIQEIKARYNLIMQAMKQVMTEDVDYGKVPGTDKNTLFASGAETLRLVSKLKAPIDPVRDVIIQQLPGGHLNVMVYCHILDQSGEEIATGVGSCSTMESKYRYRGGLKEPTGEEVPAEYWNVRKESGTEAALEIIGGPGFGVAKIDGKWEICKIGEKMENPDIADQYNTVIKMAKKRSFVDGILSGTGARKIFTQDYDDLFDEAGNIKPNARKKGKTPTMPQRKSQTKPQQTNGQDNHIPDTVPPCPKCGGPLGKDDADAAAVVKFCTEKKGGDVACRTCQAKK